MKIIIESKEDIRNLNKLNSWLNRPHIRFVHIKFPEMEENLRKNYEGKLKHLFNDCACQWGGPIFITSLVLLYSLTDSDHLEFWPDMTLYFFISVFSAMLSKLAGLRWSFYQLKKIIDELNNNDW